MNNPGLYIPDGLSQKERYPASLDPDYFQMDERTADDLILFVTELSFNYNYYNEKNIIEGNWLDFFLADPNLMLRVFQKFDFHKYFLEYSRMRQDLLTAGDKKAFLTRLNDITGKINSFLDFQEYMFDKFKSAIHLMNDGHIVFSNIVGSDNNYKNAILAYQSLAEQIKIKTGNNFPVPGKILPGDKNDSADDLYLHINAEIKIFDDLFATFDIMHHRLLTVANHFTEQQKQKSITYQPHISLLLAFSELYQLVKKELNRFTQKHLDFYYKNILDFQPKKAVADKVAVIIDLNKQITELLLLKGERLQATGTDGQKKEIFSLSENHLVNQIKIAALKTIYKSEYNNFIDPGKGNEQVKSYRIYATEIPVPAAAEFIKNIDPDKSWSLFGEDQHYLPAERKTMKEAELGLLISSPLLFAVDGKRDFTIVFHLEAGSFRTFFLKYAVEFGEALNMRSRIIITEMLKKAFVMDITGLSGWIRIPDYSVKYSAEVMGNTGSKEWEKISDYPGKYATIDSVRDVIIEISFSLGKDDPAVAVYQPDIHGVEYKINCPVLKLMLNNYSSLNPYGFLFKQVIERITIKVNVQDSAELKLQNNIGQLSSSNPFQLFGPQPAIGSFLAMKNTNIFNRFTKSVRVKLNWLDLPRISGGFKAYYDGYGNNIRNESFKVGFSGLIDGDYLPKREQQKLLNLFETENKFLTGVTSFDNIMSHNIRFENEPLLNKENSGDLNFKDGAIRIELAEPEDTFCQKLYPVLLPKILIHNSKWYHRNLPVPNQPFIPMVSSVSVDYELEHAEAVFGKKGSFEQSDIGLWHIYPFGFRKMYPQERKEDIIMIPAIDHQSNLFIALSGVNTGNELSVLFQMEENNFQELSDNDSTPSWSYLYLNEWKDIDPADILEDNTNNFKGTGIIKLIIPGNISKGNTLFDPAYYWLRVSCDEHIGSKIKAVFAQAVTAVRELDVAAENTELMHLDPLMIKEFNRKIPGVANIYQPFYSYHGSAAETNEKFYTRVSESLRHKQRLITAPDIYQKILELFPEIDTVICFNSKEEEPSGDHAGDEFLKIVVIPKLKYTDDKKITEPKVNTDTLYKIKKYLSEHLSPFIREKVKVCNPEYEKIKVFCNVSFSKNYREISYGLLKQNLDRDIRTFLSPWLFSISEEIKTNKVIFPSEIFNFIKGLPYIDKVYEFKIVHFYSFLNENRSQEQARIIDSNAFLPYEESPFLYEGKEANPKIFFKASKPGAILISSERHSISSDKYSIDLIQGISGKISGNGKEKKKINTDPTGIGQLAIGSEFLVMDPYKILAYPGISKDSIPGNADTSDFYFNTNS